MSEEKKGPRVGAPDAAMQGFLKSAGLKSPEQAEIRADKKGRFLCGADRAAGAGQPGGRGRDRALIVRNFPWPKSMRWAAASFAGCARCIPSYASSRRQGGAVRDRRHQKRQGDARPSFMAPKPFAVRNFDDYAKRLRDAYVILDPREREAIILKGAQARRQELVLSRTWRCSRRMPGSPNGRWR